MSNIILQKKLLFYYHLANLDKSSLAGSFFTIQNSDASFKGVVSECDAILKEWKISNVTAYTKKQWSRFIKQKIFALNKEELIFWSKDYKKINTEDYAKEPFKIKAYLGDLNLSDAQSIKMNYKSSYKSSNFLCSQCLVLDPEVKHEDTQEALLYDCQANSDLKMKYDISDLKQEAAFYREIIERRNQLSGG